MPSLFLFRFATFLLLLNLLACSPQKDSKTLTPSLLWEVSKDINTPESVYFDPSSQKIFVSNIAGQGTEKDSKGWITTLDKTGQVSNAFWYKGLNAPKGMRAHKGSLWVSDIDRVLEIEIKSAKLLNSFTIEGAQFLNDIAIDPKSGELYVSDTIGDTVYRISKSKISPLISKSEILSPNGLLVIENNLFIASWGQRINDSWETKIWGDLYQFNLKEGRVTQKIAKELGHLDGLEKLDDHSFLITDWSAGKLYRVQNNGKFETLLDGFRGAADLAFIKEENLVIIPRMNENKVSAYSLK